MAWSSATHNAGGAGLPGYLTNQGRWIVAAETLAAAGEVVRSGASEKGVDLVINRRRKGRRGMRWTRTSADALVTLRTTILNQESEAASSTS